MAHIPDMVAHPPSAASSALGCAQSYTYHLPAIIEQPQSNKGTPWQSQYRCESVADRFNVKVEDLLRWNPSLSSEDCVLQPRVDYCVVKVEKSERPSTTSSVNADGGPPICTYDPKKGEYICPDLPTCTFDPQKGEYDCPEALPTGGVDS